MTNYITMGTDGKLIVPNNPAIGVLEGDGIGKEITGEMRRLLDAAVLKTYKGNKAIDWKELLIGKSAYEQEGSYLPQSTLAELRRILVGIKGPTDTPLGGGHASVNVGLRKELDLGVCRRPVRYFEWVSSPMSHPENVCMDIFRENVEGSYVGVEFNQDETQLFFSWLAEHHPEKLAKIPFKEDVVVGLDFASEFASKRIMRAAFDYAIKNNKKSVTIACKPNIKKIVDGSFQKRCLEVCYEEYADYCYSAEEEKKIWSQYNQIRSEVGVEKNEAMKNAEAFRKSKFEDAGKVQIQTLIMDNFLQQAQLRPQDHDVIVLQNLNGDYASDAVAAQVGGIGIAPGANINFITGHAIFEATHGTAPLIVGKGVANPSSIILSGVMMMEYIAWHEVANNLTISIQKTLAEGSETADLGGGLNTIEYTNALISNLP